MISQGKLYSAYNTPFIMLPFLKESYGRYMTGFRKTATLLYYSRDFNPCKNKVPQMRRHQSNMNNGFIQITKRPMFHPPQSNIRGIYLYLTTYYCG
ncbi:hypothetical protein C922_05055 [Plasmodium inui San Antonio 1]|uniref:Uncharacterized protein n=1 Tax=Plasmodium inui San Antonio 1 TaxID=1237626 RepID=W7A684_9APIC|nr:hypothetical protein C922_05055 [Plasmodium inui San Antonio 1]EUD64584.1 hypothetical protein C922_05055 [Plasmodium inui San Antonio 1]